MSKNEIADEMRCPLSGITCRDCRYSYEDENDECFLIRLIGVLEEIASALKGE